MTRRELYNLIEPDRFTRSWWLARLRGAMWVALVSAFLWIWADVEFADEMELSATVQLAVAQSSNLELIGKSRFRVNFKVQGRQRSLVQLQQRLLKAPNVTIKHVVTEGEDDVSIRDILNANEMIAGADLTVVSASPNHVPVELRKKVYEPDIPVQFDYTGALNPEVQVEPVKMGIHVAESDWQKILQREPKPVLLTRQVDLKSIPDPSKPFPVEVIPQIAGLPVDPDQLTVSVRVKVHQLTETQEIAVPVQALQPPSWLEDDTWTQYTLSRKDRAEWRVTLTVTGPRADLDRLKLKPDSVRAYIALTDEDRKPVSWLTRQVEVELPRDLNVQLSGAPPTVTFKLEKSATPGIP
jgi:hypothetical protein